MKAPATAALALAMMLPVSVVLAAPADAPAGWRFDGTGHFPNATPPMTWGMKADGAATNIAWATEMPFYSPSSVIVAGPVLITTANDFSLVCVDKKTGKILWIRSVSPYDAATREERAAHADVFAKLDPLAAKRDGLNAKICASPADAFKLGTEVDKTEKEMMKLLRDADKEKFKNTGMTWSDGGFMASCPAFDGTCVYAWNAWGVTACFDLKGARKWIRFDAVHPQEHGHYGSPLIVGDKVVVEIGRQYLALDRKTGKEIWRSEFHKTAQDWFGYWYGSAVLTRIGAEDVIVAGDGSLIRARDGVRFSKGTGNQCTSPVVGGGMVFWLTGGGASGGPAYRFALPKDASAPYDPGIRNCSIDMTNSDYMFASPLYHEGLLYVVSGKGILFVYDVAADKLVYRKDLDFGEVPKRADRPYACGVGASPTLAGGKIFIVGNFGTTLILEPGRVYKELGRNTIEKRFNYNWRDNQLEGTVSSPWFEGPNIYYRAQKYFYCIRGK